MEKKPFVTKSQVEEIVKTYPTPFHLYDEKGIRENAKKVKEAFAWNPGFREYFAVKATPNPYILKILQEYDMGCDCSSYTELMLAKSCGFDGKHIMFSSNDTPAEEFAYADELGAIINLDDFTHIDFLEETIGHIPETISCRYNPGGVFELSNGIMDNPGDSKYGMTKDQLIEAFKILKDKGAKHFGVHAFLASNTVTNEYYPKLAGELFELIVELKEKTGCDIRFVNLSGGVGIPYTPDKEPNDIAVIGEGVHKKFDEILVPAGLGDVSIYTEMGRFMLGPYGCLVTKAIHEKHIYKEYIGVDACAANLMRPAIYGAYHHITVLGKENAPCDHVYDVTGSLCENCDKFAVDRKLPEIDMGDYLVIHDTGAHGFSMGYNYNGRLRSAELLLKEDGSVTKVEMKDEYSKVEISKTDITTGKELEGAKLQIIRKDGTVLEEWITDGKPHSVVKLPVNEELTLREITAPDGYEIAEDVTFTLEDTMEVQKVEMKDARTPEKTTEKTNAPKTGDNQKVWAFVLLALASAGTVTGVTVYRRKKSKMTDNKEETEEK